MLGAAALGAVLMGCRGSANSENRQAPTRPAISSSLSQGQTVGPLELGVNANCKDPKTLRPEHKTIPFDQTGPGIKVGNSHFPINPPGEIYDNSGVDGLILRQRREPGHTTIDFMTPDMIYSVETRLVDFRATDVTLQFSCPQTR